MYFYHLIYNKNSASFNLTEEEFAPLKSLSNDSLIIQKSDKGNYPYPLLMRIITYKKC